MLERGWTGRRVSVRRVVERAADGRLHLGDVVGELVGLDAQNAVVDTRDGPVEVPLALVTAARLVVPSTRAELDLQDVAARGLRAAHTHELDGWLLRADDARPRRANSVLPRAQLRMPVDDALARAREWYAGFGKAVLVQIPYPARRLLDAALAERGWSYERQTDVLVASLAGMRRPDLGVEVSLDPEPDDGWMALQQGEHELLTRHDNVVFASVRSGPDVLAVARGAIDGAWLGLTSLVVAEAARRRGLGTRVTGALGAWATARGARRGYLQVEEDNAPAHELYAELGFTLHHTYHYRRAP